jgi:hypothetical protein
VAAVAQPKAQPKRPHADEDVNPFEDNVAIRAVCPNCGALDWFEWKFLGHLKDPVCGHSWYAGSVTYTLMQIRAAFSFGRKYAKHTTSGTSGVALWPVKAFFWFVYLLLGLGVRLEFGILMIPIQALAGLGQTKKTTGDIVTRVVVLAVAVGGIGIGVYKLQHAARPQFQQVQSSQPAFTQFNQPKRKKLPKHKLVPSAPFASGTHSTTTSPQPAQSQMTDPWPWLQTVAQGNTEQIRALLQTGVNVNLATPEGSTALHVAAARGYRDIAVLLLRSGANVNARIQTGATPLIFAALSNHPDLVRVLLSSGADCSIRGGVDQHTALEVAREHGADEVVQALNEGCR